MSKMASKFQLSIGKVIPREITLASRPLPRRQFHTPAPGEYNVDKLDKSKLQSGGCIRGYTFGHPNPSLKSSHTPGKNDQNISDLYLKWMMGEMMTVLFFWFRVKIKFNFSNFDSRK